ncbi:DUF72 domain-containing protein [Chloroflexota bacterium]
MEASPEIKKSQHPLGTILIVMPVFVGTCSWTDKMLVESGQFYPAARPSPEQMLRHYSSIFPTVEVDSSFYSLPSKRNSELWVERTPKDFVFHVKSYSLFTTHGTPPQRMPRDIVESLSADLLAKNNLYIRDMPREATSELWRRFREAILPLYEADKLGLILLQFPRWFVPSAASEHHIISCKDELSIFDVAVEFRQKDWLREDRQQRTLDFLRANSLSFVSVDEPQGFGSSVPPVAEATSERAYVRFHGRNTDTWEKRGITANERFNYWYTPDDLIEWVPRIRQLEEQTMRVDVLINTNYANQGPMNAQMLMDILA